MFGSGWAALLLGLLTTWGTYTFLRDATHTEGTVVELIEVKPKSKGDGIQYRPRYEFTDTAGVVHTLETDWQATHPGYATGDAIPVAYDPAAPAGAVAGGTIAQWVLPAGLLAMGAVILVAGSGWLDAGLNVEVGGKWKRVKGKKSARHDESDDAADGAETRATDDDADDAADADTFGPLAA